jgi:Fe-S oxidoreductase
MAMRLELKNYADCQGCSLCILPCPMWQQHRDVMFSPQGIAKAMQSGAQAEDLREPLASCIQCGACDVMCPENIDLTSMMTKAWRELSLPVNPKKEDVLSPFIISCDANVQAQIGKNDLYIIDAAPFHADYTNRVEHYDALRKQTGCQMNLDLNRMAIATGVGSVADESGQFDVQQQVQWLVQGRNFKRVIVENRTDMSLLREVTGKPVFCVAELLGIVIERRGEDATG